MYKISALLCAFFVSVKKNILARERNREKLYQLENKLCGYILHTSKEDVFKSNLTHLADYLEISHRHLLKEKGSKYRILNIKGIQERGVNNFF